MTELDLDELDPGIRRTVRLLRALGFDTTDSGDGKSKAQAIAEGEALDVPHVAIRTSPEQMRADADRLAEMLGGAPHAIELPPASIEATYCPIQKSAIIMIFNIDDSALVEAEIDDAWIAGLEGARETA